MAIDPAALHQAAAGLHRVADPTREPGPGIFDSFPERGRTDAAARAAPPECQRLRRLCTHCQVFTSRLRSADAVCDLKSCGKDVVDFEEDCYRVDGVGGKLEKLAGIYRKAESVNGKATYVNDRQCRIYFNSGWKLHADAREESSWSFSSGRAAEEPPEGHWQASAAGEGCMVSALSKISSLAHVLTGSLDGAVYAVAVPKLWNRRLLLYLHGPRPLGAPLVAELALHGACFRSLLEDGWMVAATSYRAHGLALSEALGDVVALRRRLPKLIGEELEFVLLEGHSTGGLAATLLIERHPELFSAAVAVGAPFNHARLDLPQNRGVAGAAYGSETRSLTMLEPISYRPLAPLLLLVNDSEASPAVLYARRAWDLHDAGDEDVLVPAVWVIRRPGHVAVNQAERLNAIQSALRWARYGSFGSARGRPVQGDDALWKPGPACEHTTREPAAPLVACRVVTQVLRQALGDVRAIRHTGSFTTSITREALGDLGIVRVGDRFRVTLGDSPGGPPYHVLMATLSEAPQLRGVEDYGLFGELESEHNWLSFAMKTYEYLNLAKALCLYVGMRVAIEVTETKRVGKSRAQLCGEGAGTGKGKGSLKGKAFKSAGKDVVDIKGKGKGKAKGKWVPLVASE